MILLGLDIALGGYLVSRCANPPWRRKRVQRSAAQSNAATAESGVPAWARRNRGYAPALALGAGMVGVFALGLDRLASFEGLNANLHALRAAARNNTALTALGFLGVFTAFSTVGVLGVEPLLVLSGLLFGTWLGAALCVVGMTLAGSAVYLATRSLIREMPAAPDGTIMVSGRFSGTIEKMRAGYREGGARYLLSLRLLPMMPVWPLHVGSAVLGVSFGAFVLETFFGSIPTTLLFTAIGSSLAALINDGNALNADLLASSAVTGPLALASVLWLLITVFQLMAARRIPASPPPEPLVQPA